MVKALLVTHGNLGDEAILKALLQEFNKFSNMKVVVFSDNPKDINYMVRKNKITIIGLECNDYCDEYASCKVVKNDLPKGGYDLFLTDIGDEYLVHVNTL